MRIPAMYRVTIFMLTAFGILFGASDARAWDDGVALTPPMGWNSWNKFACNVSEDLIKSMADGMVGSGMKDAGYQYAVIDDCWQVSRDADGNIVADPKRFPSGIKALADYVHSKGLKFGIYSDAGEKTCAGRPGSMGHEYQDALMYAKWGVDYLKYDWCNTGKRNAEEAYSTMRDALKATGRPIVFSMCEWGTAKPWLWAKDVGNLWRTTSDISDKWSGAKKWPDGSCCELGMLNIVDLQVGLESFAGGVSSAFQSVVHSGGAVDCGKRFAQHDAGHQRNFDQQGSHRGEPRRTWTRGQPGVERRGSGNLVEANAGWQPGGAVAESRRG